MFNLFIKKVRIRNSKYQVTKFDIRVFKTFIVAILYSLFSVYFIHFISQIGISGITSVMGVWGVGLIICIIFLAIVFWFIAVQTFNDVKLNNTLTKIEQASVEYLDFYNEYIEVCKNLNKFKIEYKNVNSIELNVNTYITPRKCYLSNLKLHITYNSENKLENITITQKSSFRIIDQIFDVLYFTRNCTNFSLKFSNESELLKTTFGKAISTYLQNNYRHTLISFLQTSTGIFIIFIAILSLIIAIIGIRILYT